MIKVKAWDGTKVVAEYIFDQTIDAFMFATGMRKKNYKIEFERVEDAR